MSMSIEINGVSVNVTKGAGGDYYFQMAHMLRAAGIPEGLSYAMWSGANRAGYGKMSLDGVSTGHPVRFINIKGYRAYIIRAKVRVESGSMDARRRRDMRQYLRSLERCLSICEDWIGARESSEADSPAGQAPSAPEEAGNVLCGAKPVEKPKLAEEPEPAEEPKLVEEPEPAEEFWPAEEPKLVEELEPVENPEPVEESSGGPGAGSVRRLFTEGPVSDVMMESLSAKLPLLCSIFGISPELSREEQLLRIVWLLSFRSSDNVTSPVRDDSDVYRFHPLLSAEQRVEASSLWKGRIWCDVEDLVKAAMLG